MNTSLNKQIQNKLFHHRSDSAKQRIDVWDLRDQHPGRYRGLGDGLGGLTGH